MIRKEENTCVTVSVPATAAGLSFFSSSSSAAVVATVAAMVVTTAAAKKAQNVLNQHTRFNAISVGLYGRLIFLQYFYVSSIC